MVPLIAWLASFGVCDIVADLSGRPRPGLRSRLGLVLGTVAALCVAVGLGVSAGSALVTCLVMAGALALWLWSRTRWLPRRGTDSWEQRKAIAASWGYVIATLAVVASLPLWPPAPASPPLGRWLAESPFAWAQGASAETAALAGAGFVWLAATGNALVRLVFASIGEDVPRGSEPLKGGRIIGPLERWLILALVLLGHATTAGIVVAGKGLLRFAEIRSDPSQQAPTHEDGGPLTSIQWKTEYLLVGSLASWMLPLALAALLIT